MFNATFNNISVTFWYKTGFRSCGANAVLCKTCNVLLCVIEQPIIDNSRAGHHTHGVQFGAIGPIVVVVRQFYW